MKKDKVAIAVVLDKSSSMGGVRAGTISGYNEFLDTQLKQPGEATLTLVFFDTVYDVKFVDKPLKEVPKLTEETYAPEGMTALSDAVARTITELGHKLKSLPEAERPEKVIIVIITDGAENSSKEYQGIQGKQAVKKMVDHQKEKYNWQFMFIGAGAESVVQASAADYGVSQANAASYNVGNEQEVFKSAGASTSRARAGATMDFNNVERGSMRGDKP